MSTFLLVVLGLVVSIVVLVVLAARNRDRVPLVETPPPCTSNDPRCLVVARRLDEARSAMKARGTRLLLDGRPAWVRVSGGLVVPIHRV